MVGRKTSIQTKKTLMSFLSCTYLKRILIIQLNKSYDSYYQIGIDIFANFVESWMKLSVCGQLIIYNMYLTRKPHGKDVYFQKQQARSQINIFGGRINGRPMAEYSINHCLHVSCLLACIFLSFLRPHIFVTKIISHIIFWVNRLSLPITRKKRLWGRNGTFFTCDHQIWYDKLETFI